MTEGKSRSDENGLIDYPNYLGADEAKFGPKASYKDKTEEIDDMPLPEPKTQNPNYLGADEAKFGPKAKDYGVWHAKRTLIDTDKYEGEIDGQKQKAFDIAKQGATIESKRTLSREEVMQAINQAEDPTITIETSQGRVSFKLTQVTKVTDGTNVILNNAETVTLEENKPDESGI